MRKKLHYLIILFLSIIVNPAKAQENRLSPGVPAAFNGVSENKTSGSVTRFEMEQNSPNPFSTVTQIDFSSPVQGFVEFKIVNLIGKEIYHRVMEAEAGRNTIKVESDDYIPGVYVYSLSNGSQTITRRMVISRR